MTWQSDADALKDNWANGDTATTASTGDVDPHTGHHNDLAAVIKGIKAAYGLANGIASLGADGILTLAQRPAVATHFATATTTTMLGSDTAAAVVGDYADVAAGPETYQLTSLSSGGHTNAANWALFGASAPVQSVDGRQGIVTLADLYSAIGHNHDGRYVLIPAEPLGGVPSGLIITGHSYVGDLDGFVLGGRTSVPSYRASENLRRKYGLPDCWRTFTVHGAANNTASNTEPLFAPRTWGSIHSVYYTSLFASTGGGGGTARTLNVQNGGFFGGTLAQHALPVGGNLVGGIATIFPRVLTPGVNLLHVDQQIYWTSLNSTGLYDGGGGIVDLFVNGGDYSNYAVSGCSVATSDIDGGGWAMLDHYISHNICQAGWYTPRPLITNSASKIDRGSPVHGLPVHVAGLNDLTQIGDQDAWQESVRHVLAAMRWVVRDPAADILGGLPPSITQSGTGGSFTTFQSAPYIGYLGVQHYWSGTIGGTKPYIQYALPADYNGEPVDLCFMSEPGRGGGTATIKIGPNAGALAAPDYAGGVRINGTSSDQITTDGLVAAKVAGYTRMDMIPVTKRITGLSPGAQVLRVTIDTMGAGSSRFYLNGMAREAAEKPQIFANIPAIPVMSGGQITLTQSYNSWTDDVIAEFDDVYLADLYTAMSPGGVPIQAMFQSDGTHPNRYGAQVVANVIDQVIQTIPSRLLCGS